MRGRAQGLAATAAATAIAAVALAACAPGAPDVDGGTQPDADDPARRDFEIITVLSKDGIPAIDQPAFWSADEADEAYSPDDLVIGVARGGEAKAYSLPHMSRHEIVNDTIAGAPISVTW